MSDDLVMSQIYLYRFTTYLFRVFLYFYDPRGKLENCNQCRLCVFCNFMRWLWNGGRTKSLLAYSYLLDYSSTVALASYWASYSEYLLAS